MVKSLFHVLALVALVGAAGFTAGVGLVYRLRFVPDLFLFLISPTPFLLEQAVRALLHDIPPWGQDLLYALLALSSLTWIVTASRLAGLGMPLRLARRFRRAGAILAAVLGGILLGSKLWEGALPWGWISRTVLILALMGLGLALFRARECSRLAAILPWRGIGVGALSIAALVIGDTVLDVFPAPIHGLSLGLMSLGMAAGMVILSWSWLREGTRSANGGQRFRTLYGLSARESEVLELVARGLTAAHIGEKLFLSPRTVENHIQSIYRKTGVNNRAELLGLVSLGRTEESLTSRAGRSPFPRG